LGYRSLLSSTTTRYAPTRFSLTPASKSANRIDNAASLMCNAIVATAMGLITWLHYALRAILIVFSRLRVLRLVKVDSTIVCWHVVEIRVIFNLPRQPSDRRLCAIVIRVRTPSAFIAAMKPSTVARCAIANELLHRRKQTVCDDTTRPSPSHHVELLSITFEEIVAERTHLEQKWQWTGRHAYSVIASPVERGDSSGATGAEVKASGKISTLASRSDRAQKTHAMFRESN
jgi:hypothetical protein